MKRDIGLRNWSETKIPYQTGEIYLRGTPVIRVDRVSSNPTDAINITRIGAGSHAVVRTDHSGDVVTGFATNGLTLQWTEMGVQTTQSIPFTGKPTLSHVATAINAISGWSTSIVDGYQNWPSSEIISYQFARNAKSDGAFLQVFSEECEGWELESELGVLTVYGSNSLYKIQYSGGYETVPHDIQECIIGLINWMFSNPETVVGLKRRKLGESEREFSDAEKASIPRQITQVLSLYKDHVR